MSASQAGRRGFESLRPLFYIFIVTNRLWQIIYISFFFILAKIIIIEGYETNFNSFPQQNAEKQVNMLYLTTPKQVCRRHWGFYQ